MKKFDPVIVTIIIICVVAIIGIIIAASRSGKNMPEVSSYTAADSEKPQIEISESFFDLGHVKNDETKTHQVKIKNIGQKELDIRDFSTSCGCTAVVVEINGQTSPIFSMHGNKSWNGLLQPEQEATLTITYDPQVHPAKGEVSRVVYFKTNDPLMPDVEINFKVFVES